LIGHQTTILQREDVTAAGKSKSIEIQTTSSTVQQFIENESPQQPIIERLATNDYSNGYRQQIENLKRQVNYSTGTVAKLTTQLSHVLSFFDLDIECCL